MQPDKITIERIEFLHPKVRNEAFKIYQEIYNNNIYIRYTSTYRSFEEQDAIYSQGRLNIEEVNKLRKKCGLYLISEKENKIVTNAKKGQSWHNYRLALDFCLLSTTGNEYNMSFDMNNNNEADWMEVVNVFKSYGWQWGSEVNFKGDTPHFQKTFDYSIEELYNKYINKEFLDYIKL